MLADSSVCGVPVLSDELKFYEPGVVLWFNDYKYVSWNTAVYVHPHGNMKDRQIYKWTVDLPPLKREGD